MYVAFYVTYCEIPGRMADIVSNQNQEGYWPSVVKCASPT